ncbi:hypothetical protein Ahy_B07g088425 [Arachis hypogaea]|uniref:Uncharacterized protein n=1 Tax=Arachis hypogaea TaxID=3818 RepID=A0A444YEH5_ARAHY|nr:hypothetical protein Ahy_B07g088425 [Arachis hypogaea]
MASTSNVAGSWNNPRSFGSIMRRMKRNREALLEDVMPCDDRTRHSVDDEEWKMKMAWKFGKLEAKIRLVNLLRVIRCFQGWLTLVKIDFGWGFWDRGSKVGLTFTTISSSGWCCSSLFGSSSLWTVHSAYIDSSPVYNHHVETHPIGN